MLSPNLRLVTIAAPLGRRRAYLPPPLGGHALGLHLCGQELATKGWRREGAFLPPLVEAFHFVEGKGCPGPWRPLILCIKAATFGGGAAWAGTGHCWWRHSLLIDLGVN
jgi:hypothetical protein